VSVAERRAKALKQMEKLRKKGVDIQPVKIEGRQIARTFWGRAWCDHLEKFSDYENRLPRGRTYVRNGSVCHLDVMKGQIAAKVSGSAIYDVKIGIKPLPKQKWRRVKQASAGQIGSLLELLQGKLADHVMAVVTDRDRGLFPRPAEISLDCSCPDWATMCKHVAAVLYGIGARLDEKPELLFLLRGVDHSELVSEETAKAVVTKARKTSRRTLDESKLSEVFGIDLAPVAGTKVATTVTPPEQQGVVVVARAGRLSRKPKRGTTPSVEHAKTDAKCAGPKKDDRRRTAAVPTPTQARRA
jgi:uncharacterized Zn finger protein